MLTVGCKYLLPQDGPCEVIKVDDCRAQVKLLTRKEHVVKAYKDSPQEMEVKFSSGSRIVDISPNSELQMIQ